MSWYLVEVWAGRGDERRNTHSLTATAGSVEEARRTVAECLGLSPAHWQGTDSPLELVVPSTHVGSEGSGQPRHHGKLAGKRRREGREAVAATRRAVGAWMRLVEDLGTTAQ